MNFLRIALFAVFLFGVIAWKHWMPESPHARPDSDTSGQVDDQRLEKVATPDTTSTRDELRIDGHPVISVASIRNAKVIDGDSIRWTSISGPVEYRLASIDAPELGQPFGQRAKKYLQSIVAGKELTAYQTDVDRYGRRVAFVFASIPGSPEFADEINARMIADGYAWHATRHSENPKLAQLQATAKATSLGLWDQVAPIAPWDYRDARAAEKSSVATKR